MESKPAVPQNSPVENCSRDNTLTDAKSKAMELLMLGNSPTEISRMMGIDRKTFYLWRKEPAFQAELNRRQAEVIEAHKVKLRQLMGKAERVLEKKLDEGNLSAAVALLRMVHAMPAPDNETDQRRIVKQMAENLALQYWCDGPFAEKTLGKSFHNNPRFIEFSWELYEALLRQFPVEPGEADLIVAASIEYASKQRKDIERCKQIGLQLAAKMPEAKTAHDMIKKIF